MSTLEKVPVAMGMLTGLQPTKPSAVSDAHIQWILCPGLAGVCGNKRADKLAGVAAIEGGLTLDSQTAGQQCV